MESVEQLIKEFNEKFPVGSSVRWRSVGTGSAPYREYTVLYPAGNHYGQAIAWFKERSGMVSVERQFVDYGK